MPDNPEAEIRNQLQDLPEVEAFLPTGPNKDLVEQIYEYLGTVNELRDVTNGLSPETVQKIEQQFMVERVRHSATIEGVDLDRRETIHILTTGQIIEGKRRSSEETRNLGEALALVTELVGTKELRETDIRTLHATLLRDLDPNAGTYRPHDVRITNASYRPPEHLDVPRLMHQLIEKINAPLGSIDGFTLGVYAHWAFARIHPFVDGNGRMARIMQDLMFLRNRLVPTPVSYQDVDQYYSALETADSGNTVPFVELIATFTLATLRKYRAAIEETQQASDWLDELIENANESVNDQDRSEFARFSQKMSEIRETFESVAARITGSVRNLECRIREYGGIDFEQFREIKNTGRASRTWDFGLSFVMGQKEIRFIFWYGRHWRRDSDEYSIGEQPVLIVSIYEDNRFITLRETDEQRISLREVALDGSGLLRVRHNPIEEKNEFDRGVDATTVCKDFITEVIKGKLNLG